MNKKALVEAILFMTPRHLSKEEIERIAGKIDDVEFEEMIDEMRERYNLNPDSGIMLDDSSGYRLVVKARYLPRVRHLSPHADLSKGLLRTLAIVAYHQPVRQADIVRIVGNRAYEYIRELESRGLVKTRKESRTKIIETTENFERYFGITSEELKKMVEGNAPDVQPGHDEGSGASEN